MTLTVRQRLYGLGTLGLLFTLAVGLSALYGISQIVTEVHRVSNYGEAVRNHVEASMFLDVTRNDASKVMTATGDAQDDAYSELNEQIQFLTGRMAQAVRLTESTPLQDALRKESGIADDYVGKLKQILALRRNPQQAAPLFGAFVQSYQALRGSMDGVNDQMQNLSRKATADSDRVVRTSREIITAICVLSSLLLLLFLAFSVARNISRRLAMLVGHLRLLADGDLRSSIDDTRADELGNLARCFNTSVDRLQEALAGASGATDDVRTASERLTQVSQQMTANAEETSVEAGLASTAAEQVNQNLTNIATATEQMSASIKDIAQSAMEAAKVADEAVKAAEATSETVVQLGQSSAEIGEVIKTITAIAQQTNLLALNATIEAARAGESGKGFAVVANEVKELARQTAKATEDIGQKIDAIRANTKGAMEGNARISTVIHQVNDISKVIATAVEQQEETTGEMSRSVREAARGAGDIARNVAKVAEAARSTSQGAGDSKNAAYRLAQMSQELRALLGQFRLRATGGGKASGDLPGAAASPVSHLHDSVESREQTVSSF